MSDHMIWVNDIENRFSPSSLTDAVVGDGYVATAIISAVTTNSAWQMSQWDAYKDLREKLLGGEPGLFALSTTVQRSALTDVVEGARVFNTDSNKFEIYHDSTWYGFDSADLAAYGVMYEDNSSGSDISVSTSYAGWVTATQGNMDDNLIVTFDENSTADRLSVGSGGDYTVDFHASVTNSGGKLTTAAIHLNGVEQPSLKMAMIGDSSKPILLASSGILIINEGEYIDLRFKSEDSDTVTVFQVNVNVHRVADTP